MKSKCSNVRLQVSVLRTSGPLVILGGLGVIFIFFISSFIEISLCKQNSPRWDAVFSGITSGAISLAYVA